MLLALLLALHEVLELCSLEQSYEVLQLCSFAEEDGRGYAFSQGHKQQSQDQESNPNCPTTKPKSPALNSLQLLPPV